jgi:hypothetical protein
MGVFTMLNPQLTYTQPRPPSLRAAPPRTTPAEVPPPSETSNMILYAGLGVGALAVIAALVIGLKGR